MNKKARASFIVGLIIVLVSSIVVLNLEKTVLDKSQDNFNEEICRISMAEANNAAILGKQVLFKPKCKAQQKDIPFKGKEVKEVQKNMADLISQCWYMNLEGALSRNALDLSLWDNNCNVCYLTTITDLENNGKDIDRFPVTEQINFMVDQVKVVNAESDGCTLGGGFCVGNSKFESEEDCLSTLGFKFNEKSNKCKTKYVTDNGCCFSGHTCLNNGGECSGSCGEGTAEYSTWGCSSGNKCCVKKENHYNYLDYVQRSKGPGRVVFDGILENFVEDEQVYAITFVANTDALEGVMASTSLLGGVLGTWGGATTGAAIAGTFVGTIITATSGGLLTPVALTVSGAVAGAVAGSATLGTIGTIVGSETAKLSDDLNYVLVSPYQRVQNYCNIQN